MKILVFAPRYAPQNNPRAVQNIRLLQYLKSTGTLITITHPGDPHENVPEGWEVKRVVNPKFRIWLRVLLKLKIPFNIPDPFVFWHWRALRLAQKAIKKNGYDLVLTISKPDSVHLLGRIIKRKYGLPWVAFFSDPWVDMEQYGYVNFSNSWVRRLNQKMEAKTVAEADQLIFTNEYQVALYKNKYGRIILREMAIIPQSYPLKYPVNQAVDEVRGEIIIRHVGHFYNERSPLSLIKALGVWYNQNPEETHGIRFEFIGMVDCFDRLAVEKEAASLPFVTFCGLVSYEESMALMQSSDILMVIDKNQEPNLFLPSKLAEYLAMEKPLLAYSPRGASADFVREANGWVINPDQGHEAVRTVCLEIKESYRAGFEKHHPSQFMLEKHHPQAIADQFMSVFVELLSSLKPTS